MRKLQLAILFFAVSVLFFSCKTHYQTTAVQYQDYKINQSQAANVEINSLLQPYKDSVNKTMNDVIAVAGMSLEKRQPEGTLGNILSDAMLIMASEKYATQVDASFVNFGGIRLPSIAAGNITRGKIFELAPFDNVIVLQKLSGKVLQQFLNLVAGRGGWPCAGISFQLKNKKAVNVLIGGKPLADNDIYTIALVDYIANGGDDCDMLKVLPQQSNGYLFRDAVLDYFSRQQKNGKTINSSIQKRVSNAE
jgi:2',3'-cyclic-nucleotide 2'-phosphodiesterase (5'-nucleotidase family)